MSATEMTSSTSNASTSTVEGTTWASWVLMVFFCGSIALPLAGTLWPTSDGRDKIAKLENRHATTLQAFPTTFEEWKEYPPKVEAFTNDHFTFRGQLLGRHHALKRSLAISPSPMVAIGKDGWHFFNHPDEWGDVTGRDTLSTLEKTRWLAYLNTVHDRLKEEGILFLAFIAPDKSSIYPEYLPAHGAGATRKRRLNELLTFLQENDCRASVLDLRDTLRARKAEAPLYLKCDTHWNLFAAAVASDSILQRVQELGAPLSHLPRPVSRKDYNWSTTLVRSDLSLTSGDAEELPVRKGASEDSFRLELDSQDLLSVFPEITGQPGFRISTHRPGGSGRLLMFRDSFGTALVDSVSRCFQRADYFWMYPTEDHILRAARALKPDVVISVMVERSLPIPRTTGPEYEPAALVSRFLSEELYTVTRKKAENLHLTRGRATVEPSGAGFTVDHQGGTPEIRLDRLPALRRGLKAFRCSVKSPGTSVLQLRGPVGPPFGEVPLKPGGNKVAILLPYEDLPRPLFIRLGNASGEYVFRNATFIGTKAAAGVPSAKEPAPENQGE